MSADADKPAAAQAEDFFDPAFMSELEDLAATLRDRQAHLAVSTALPTKLSAFLAPSLENHETAPLNEEGFIAMGHAPVASRANLLIELCRQGCRRDALESVESFIVFFQALLPSLAGDGAIQVKRFFFRLVPTLLHIAANDFGDTAEKRADGRAALHNLESILTEISAVRLTPTESDLVFRSIDQLAAFIGVGEYAMANELISSQLLSIISRNRLARGLYRIMEVEVAIQCYLKEKVGYLTPQVRIPEDYSRLSSYGPIHFINEETETGHVRHLLQLQIPDIPILRDVVLHVASQSSGLGSDYRLDGLGTVELRLADGAYSLGLVYQPPEVQSQAARKTGAVSRAGPSSVESSGG